METRVERPPLPFKKKEIELPATACFVRRGWHIWAVSFSILSIACLLISLATTGWFEHTYRSGVAHFGLFTVQDLDRLIDQDDYCEAGLKRGLTDEDCNINTRNNRATAAMLALQVALQVVVIVTQGYFYFARGLEYRQGVAVGVVAWVSTLCGFLAIALWTAIQYNKYTYTLKDYGYGYVLAWLGWSFGLISSALFVRAQRERDGKRTIAEELAFVTIGEPNWYTTALQCPKCHLLLGAAAHGYSMATCLCGATFPVASSRAWLVLEHAARPDAPACAIIQCHKCTRVCVKEFGERGRSCLQLLALLEFRPYRFPYFYVPPPPPKVIDCECGEQIDVAEAPEARFMAGLRGYVGRLARAEWRRRAAERAAGRRRVLLTVLYGLTCRRPPAAALQPRVTEEADASDDLYALGLAGPDAPAGALVGVECPTCHYGMPAIPHGARFWSCPRCYLKFEVASALPEEARAPPPEPVRNIVAQRVRGGPRGAKAAAAAAAGKGGGAGRGAGGKTTCPVCGERLDSLGDGGRICANCGHMASLPVPASEWYVFRGEAEAPRVGRAPVGMALGPAPGPGPGPGPTPGGAWAAWGIPGRVESPAQFA
eukprot:tig00001249_g7780.t1